MGRRALPKVNPAIVTSNHLFELEDLSPPIALENFFADPTRPLELEIGSGRGLFINTAAAEHPERNFIGIELAKRYAHFSASRLARSKIKNAIMIAGDGLKFANEFFAKESVSAVHVYFPDPWWKGRHRKRRVMREPLLNDIEKILMPGGELHFWTDVKEYFDSTLKLIAKVTQLDGPHSVDTKTPEHDLDYRTHFERRMRMHNKPVYRSLYQKHA